MNATRSAYCKERNYAAQNFRKIMSEHYNVAKFLPWKEADRLAALRGFEILDTDPEPVFDGLVRIAAQICDTPIALVTFIDEGRQWFKAEIGLGIRETPLDISICVDAILQPGLFIVSDTTEDPRFRRNPLVTGEPRLRFYAGVRLETAEGLPLGTLCVLDGEPRPEGLSDTQSQALTTLAQAVMSQLELRRTNKALARRERHYKAITEAIPHIVWSADSDGRNDYYNQRWYEFTGIPLGSTKGEDRNEAAHPDDRNRARARWRHSLETGEGYEIKYRLRHRSGHYRWTLERALAVRNEQGEIERWFGTYTDINEVKTAEAALAESEARYRALVEASAAIVWRAAPDGSVLEDWGWERFCGQSPEARKGYGWLDVLHPDDREHVKSFWQKLRASGQPGTSEYRIRHLSGEYKWVLARNVPLRNADGAIREWVGTITDIHEQKIAAERLRRSEERYRALIDASASVVWFSTREGSMCGDFGWSELSGQTPEEYAGEGWLDAIHPEDRDRVKTSWEQAIASSTLYVVEFRMRYRDGYYRWVLARGVPLKRDDGAVREWVGTLTDIHVRKQAEEELRTGEERLRLAVETTRTGIWDVDLANGHRQWTEEAREILGVSADTPITRESFLDRVHPEDRPRMERKFFASERIDELGYNETCRIIRADDGELRWVAASGRTLLDTAGRPVRKIGTIQDITRRKQSEEALRASGERLRLALHVGRMVVWEQDLTTDCVIYCENGIELLGIGCGPFADFVERVHPEDRPQVETFFRRTDAGISDTVEFRYTPPHGRTLWLGARARSAKPDRLFGVIFDLTDRKAAEEEIWHIANHDPLTGLPNRALFQRRLENSLAEAGRNGTSVVLLLIDLDRVKDVNDTLGHDAGDALLKEMGARLAAMIRDRDTVARLGGDEFAVVITEPPTLDHAISFANIVTGTLSYPFTYAGRTFATKASIGISVFPDHDLNATDLMKDADFALYQAKAQGRDRIIIYSPSLRAETVQKASLSKDVRQAILHDQIVPFYQPKVCLSTGRIIGFEALARWRHPARGILTPGVFGAVFDDHELAVAISRLLMAEVTSDMRQWLDKGLAFGDVALNLSPAEFTQPKLAETILGVLDSMHIPTNHFEVEVTETVFLGRSFSNVSATLNRLHDRGVRIALDDFGTGYASLTHLKQFPVDHVKIDRSFVGDIERNAGDAAIVAAVIGLGRSLNLEVTAEGVETIGQAQRLRDLGCGYAQGHLYSQPMPGAQVPKFLARWEKRESGPA